MAQFHLTWVLNCIVSTSVIQYDVYVSSRKVTKVTFQLTFKWLFKKNYYFLAVYVSHLGSRSNKFFALGACGMETEGQKSSGLSSVCLLPVTYQDSHPKYWPALSRLFIYSIFSSKFLLLPLPGSACQSHSVHLTMVNWTQLCTLLFQVGRNLEICILEKFKDDILSYKFMILLHGKFILAKKLVSPYLQVLHDIRKAWKKGNLFFQSSFWFKRRRKSKRVLVLKTKVFRSTHTSVNPTLALAHWISDYIYIQGINLSDFRERG